MISKKKADELMWWIYRELFKASTPPRDFDELVKNATINSRGEKEIPFMDYEISQEDMDKIIEQSYKRFVIKSKFDKQIIKNSIYLGCSLKTKYDGKEKKV